MLDDSAEYLRRAAEYGPVNTAVAENLRGWWTPNGLYVCAKCAGRILGRGCHFPTGSSPVWIDSPEPYGACCVCEMG